ncbi:uncharacterized protein LOC120630860 [Pararge aegeria]|uniref:Jg19569 protein n=1 Tax=Pararge aegeria aegeria TaxID=348720 RepID=A0A8S4RET8_9NEOP|nr:uncharacterized protein LOC120630860 [Pararge aegeria]CAH2233798.1 jg19569 [Pararge aegeria aegeria]
MFVFILTISGVISLVSSESCIYRRCLGCHPQETVWEGSSVECNPSNWVSAQWVHNLGHPPPSTGSIIPIEMRCLKMIATPDDKSFGNTVDTIRGCVPKAQVDSVCNALVAVERARGHSDARCFICYGDNCNFAKKDQAPINILLVSAVLYFILR